MNDSAVTSRRRLKHRPKTRLPENFPNADWYRNILSFRPNLVREAPTVQESFPFSERHIQCIWSDTTWRPDLLRTSTGEDVVVRSPGRWNLEAGPDFLDAEILIGPGNRQLRGDIEVHIRPSDWTAHGHGADPRYSRVVAHVCYYEGNLPGTALPPGAVSIPLRPLLRQNPIFSFEAIDVAAYPYATIDSDRPPCAEALLKLPPKQHEALLDAAGQERIRLKSLRMQKAINERGPEQSLYEEIMAALGYKQNQRAFRKLSRQIPVEAMRMESDGNPEKGYAVLLGVSGLLPKLETGHDRETRMFLRTLWDHWWKRQGTWKPMSMHCPEWQRSGLRPQNQPVRRLAAAAAIFSNSASLSERLAELETHQPTQWFKEAAGLIENAAGLDYWQHRLAFSGKVSPTQTALVGRQRTATILSNVIIPHLAAIGNDVSSLLDRLPAEQDNALIRRTAYALFGRDHNPAFYRKGILQQGLLQVFHDFCLNTRTGCPDCALSKALGTMAESCTAPDLVGGSAPDNAANVDNTAVELP